MIVDDELIVRKGLEALLDWEKEGYQITDEAESGEEALRKIREMPPDIILTDLYMVGGDGFYLINAVKSLYPHIPIIVLSSYNDFENVRKAMKLGASDYIFKLTVNPEELLKTLKEVSSGIQDSASDDKTHPEYQMRILKALSEDKDIDDDVSIPESIINGFAAVLIHADDFSIISKRNIFPDWQRTRKLISGMIEETMRRNGDALTIDYSSSDIIALTARNSDSYEELRDEMDILARRIRNATAISVSIVISSLKHGRDSIIGGIREALTALPRLFYTSDSVYIVHTDKQYTKPELPEEFSSDAYLSLLNSGDAVGAIRKFRAELGYFREHHGWKKSDTIKTLVEAARYLSLLIDTSDITLNSITLSEAIYLPDRFSTLFSYSNSILDAIEEEVRQTKPARKEIIEIISYVRNNLSKDISVAEAAEKANMSESNFSHVFTDEKGISFSKFVSRMKMEKAAELLATTDMRINEISDAIGISNPNYFSVQFRKAYGLSPMEFRGDRKQQEKED